MVSSGYITNDNGYNGTKKWIWYDVEKPLPPAMTGDGFYHLGFTTVLISSDD